MKTIAAAAFIAIFLVVQGAGAGAPTRISESFDKDWRFIKGDPPLAPSFGLKDDSWRKLDLPHDWVIEGPFDEHAPSTSAGASLPSGVAWYRKTFVVPPQGAGKRIFIEFDGVMANSEVYINNALLGTHPYGYTALRYELTDYLDRTGPNLLAVRTDTSRQPASRWYAGAGIYLHTRLVTEDAIHIEPWATVLTTPKITSDVATVHVETMVINQSTTAGDVAIDINLTAPDGSALRAQKLSAVAVGPGQSARFTADISVDHPHLWDIDSPSLYSANVRVLNAGTMVDEETRRFGIRTAEFRADTGFWLNGRNIKILGMGLHSDAGALGMAVPASAWESRLKTLKSIGVNAVRTAHNPPSPEFLDACDRLGLLVMEEAFDAWSVGKVPADYHLHYKDWWQRDLTAMMQRDRNHPSIILYSLGNEIWDILPQNPDPADDQFVGPIRSIDIAKNEFVPMRDLAHALDPTRPVTLAILRPNVSGIYDNGFSDLVDVVGQNYRDNELAAAHMQNPARKILGTEDYKTVDTWRALRDNPALSGQFIWSGMDYLGEAGKWPNVVSPSGIFDRTNYPKGDALERESWWLSKPVLHIARMRIVPTRPGRPPIDMGFADWSPTDSTMHTERVNVFSNIDQVELFLNGKSLGAKPRDPSDAPRQWQVPFAPGTISAVGKDKAGEEIATDELHTAGPPARLKLTSERATLADDWDDIAYVRATVVDADGVRNPDASDLISFKITGPGTVVAVDNGALADHDPFQATQRHAYQGTCVAIIRATADTGEIVVTAWAAGLADGTVKITAAASIAR
jgi:beta-galactosidase